MKEDLLHFIWKYKNLQLEQLATSKSEPVEIIDVGSHNHLSGPDFFNAKVVIDGQLWAGNVEIHIKSSDWYAHNHEQDPNYDNVILHVVWKDDAEVYRSDNSIIPSLELENYIAPQLLKAYQNLFEKKSVSFINCEKNIAQVDQFIIENWMERLYFERLERKSIWVKELLKLSRNDWENVLFTMLLKNFGLNVNGESFLSLAKNLDFSIVRKLRTNTLGVESVFFGMSHLLDDHKIIDAYYLRLKKEFKHLERKFSLKNTGVLKPDFYKLRPPNFPTIRLSQFANLYSKNQSLFEKIMSASDVKSLYSIFAISASSYWNNHYTFGKESKKSIKRLTQKFMDLLIFNTLLPLKFCYSLHLGKDANEEIIGIVSTISREDNTVVRNFMKQGVAIKNAQDSQSVLQLYNSYCTKNKCLQCAVGNRLLTGNS